MEFKQSTTEQIEKFLNYIAHCQQESERLMKGMKTEDLRCQDLLHELELQTMSPIRMYQWLILMKKNRLERRKYKDQLQWLEPIVTFSKDPQNKAALDRLKKVVERYSKLEKEMENRTYKVRVKENG